MHATQIESDQDQTSISTVQQTLRIALSLSPGTRRVVNFSGDVRQMHILSVGFSLLLLVQASGLNVMASFFDFITWVLVVLDKSPRSRKEDHVININHSTFWITFSEITYTSMLFRT